MTRREAQIPCPTCGGKFPLPLDQMRSGASTACPHCGRTVSFQGGDAARVQQALDLLGDQVKGITVNVKVTRKS